MSRHLVDLDRLSRERELTNSESLELERQLQRTDGRRLRHNILRDLARSGVKRSGRAIVHFGGGPQ